ncbi:MAG TPA: hypothetical protein VHK64_08095 [Nocardioidaceae bacterium]|nr:hypothetical protein [Nocardioidaceae bacterium]
MNLLDRVRLVAFDGDVEPGSADAPIPLRLFDRHRRRWGIGRELTEEEVVSRAAVDEVVAEATAEPVVPGAAEQDVPPEPAIDGVRSLAALADIVADRQREEVIAGTAVDRVVTRPRQNLVGAGTGEDRVVPARSLHVAEEGGRVAEDEVVAAVSVDDVVAEPAADEVRSIRTGQRLGRIRPDHDVEQVEVDVGWNGAILGNLHSGARRSRDEQCQGERQEQSK